MSEVKEWVIGGIIAFMLGIMLIVILLPSDGMSVYDTIDACNSVGGKIETETHLISGAKGIVYPSKRVVCKKEG